MEDQVRAALAADWNFDPERSTTREEVLQALALRISALLSGSSETFFQLMYRLDIGEQQLAGALAAADPPSEIAALVWSRQVAKIASRARYSPPRDGDADLKW